MPAPTFAVSPGALADGLTVLAGALAVGALALIGFELVRLVERRRQRATVTLTPLEAALAYTRDAARRPDPADRRKALGLLATTLESEGAPALAGTTSDVAWSEEPPTPDRALELADEIEVTTRGGRMNWIPYTGAQTLARIAARTIVARVVLSVALVALVLAAAAAARHPQLNKQPLVSPKAGGVVVLDLSASISSDTYSRIGQSLRELVARGGRYGLVVFSTAAYEALPAGTPASALAPLVRYFTLPSQAVPGEQPTYPTNPWTDVVHGRHPDFPWSRARAPDRGRERRQAPGRRPDQRPGRRPERPAATPRGLPGLSPRRNQAPDHRPQRSAERPRLFRASGRHRVLHHPGVAPGRASCSRRASPGELPDPARHPRRRRRLAARGQRAPIRALALGQRRGGSGVRSRWRIALAAVAIAAAVFAALLASDLRSWQDGLRDGDARFAQQPAAATWDPSTLLPFDLARGILGISDQVAFRRAAQSFVAVNALGNGFDNGFSEARARADVEVVLTTLARSSNRARDSLADNLLGILAFSDSQTRWNKPARAGGACRRRLPVGRTARPHERRREVQPRVAPAAARRPRRPLGRLGRHRAPPRKGTREPAAARPGRATSGRQLARLPDSRRRLSPCSRSRFRSPGSRSRRAASTGPARSSACGLRRA